MATGLRYLKWKVSLVSLRSCLSFTVVLLSDGNATADLALSLFNRLVHPLTDYIVMRDVHLQKAERELGS